MNLRPDFRNVKHLSSGGIHEVDLTINYCSSHKCYGKGVYVMLEQGYRELDAK